jgi:ParB/RepB/Spo0J family partition protein
MVEPTPFQKANFLQIVQRYHPLLIRIGDGPGDFASMPRRSAIAEAQAHGQVLWEMKKTAAREAAKEIEPTLRQLARIVAGQPQTSATWSRAMNLPLDQLDLLGTPADLLAGAPLQLAIESIIEDPDQPRNEFDPEGLAELAASIKERGVLQPISVRRHPDQPDCWMLNFGARRLRASKLAGKFDIPAFVDKTADSYDQVIENEQREGLKPLELALFVQRRLAAGDTQAVIAKAAGQEPAVRDDGHRAD